MEFQFQLVQDIAYGGIICPNTLQISISGAPFIGEDNQKYISINYSLSFNGSIGSGVDERFESILYRKETQLIPFSVIALLTDVESNKAIINQILGAFTFKGFLKDFVMQIP